MPRPKTKPPTEGGRVEELYDAYTAKYKVDNNKSTLSEDELDIILYFAYEKADLEDKVNEVPES